MPKYKGKLDILSIHKEEYVAYKAKKRKEERELILKGQKTKK